MTTPLPLVDAPYVTPNILINAPTGIDWSSIPPGDDVTPSENYNEWWRMCMRATAKANGYCNQTLRATIDTELVRGPDFRVTAGPQSGGNSGSVYWMGSGTWNTRMLMSRWPILQVTQIKVSANATWPRSWQTVPTNWAEPEVIPLGIYGSIGPSSEAHGGQAIIMGPGYVDWCYGRNGYVIQCTYMNGWPHASLTSAATAGSTTLAVNDTTGWAITDYTGVTGASGTIKDVLGNQETVHATAATTTAGPGTLSLSAATAYNHAAGTLVTTLPAQIEEAVILFAAAEALTRGATTTTIHDVGGHAQHTGGDVEGLNTEAELLLHPFRRTI